MFVQVLIGWLPILLPEIEVDWGRVRLRAGFWVPAQKSEFLRISLVVGLDPRPPRALDFEFLISAISAISIGKQSSEEWSCGNRALEIDSDRSHSGA